MPDKARIQVKTNADPEVWEDVGSAGVSLPTSLPTGAATAAKQLADNHRVTVSNHPTEFPLPTSQLTTLTPPAAITGFATSANQTNGTQASKFVDESGVAYGVKHISNKPRVSSMPYLYDIAEGNVAGHTPYAKLGYNDDVGSTEEDIITQGGLYYWIPTATALEVLSTGAGAANDTLAGTGVQKVKITYLDADYSQQTQTLDMAGATPVPLTDTTILRVNSIRATQVGTGGVAAGTIICRTVAGTNTVRQITAGYTRGRGLTYTVPLGKTLYLTSVSVSSGYTTSGKVVRWTGRAQVDDTAPTVKINFFQPFFEIITEDNSFHTDFDMPVSIPATADLKMSAVSNGAGSFCSCSLRGWLE